MRRQLIVLTLLAVLHAISCSSSEHQAILSKFMDGPKKELFKVYHTLFNKEYDLNSELGLKKYKVFKGNLKLIKEENSKNLGYQLGINQFSDLTNDEYRQTLNLNIKSLEGSFLKGGKNFESSQNFKAGEVIVDHSEHMGEVKNQGSCGSCWAFGVIGAIEGNYSKKFGKKLVLSEQHLVDCDHNNYACNGGWPTYAFDFVKENGAFEQSVYEYTSGWTKVPSECQQKDNSGVYRPISSQKYCSECSYSDWQALIKEGPTNIVIDAGSFQFAFYTSGILNLSETRAANHAVIAVGLQTDGEGDYFIVRNSWGPFWGNGGHINIRVNFATNSMQGTSYAWLPVVIESAPPAPLPPRPVGECPILYKGKNYTGQSLEICSGNSDLNKKGWWREAQSMKIGKALKVDFFREADCLGNGGTRVALKEDTPNFTSNSDFLVNYYISNAQSVAVSKADPPASCIWVYEDCCYQGGVQEICQDLKDLESIGFDNKISSIRLGNGTRAVLFYNRNFDGPALGVTNDIACFDGDARMMNDNTSSISIIATPN
jgi:KDEL-tailed cysteine endopeptidase